jgi:flagellar motor switch protein FliM
MSNKQSSSIKKEIFLPSIIGDWTTYTSEQNKNSISVTKSIGSSNKTVSEETINQLLFFHQEFFEQFFDKIAKEINSHIEIDTISINVLNHQLFKHSLKDDIYQCKFELPELEQIDLILTKKATKYIAHRLCGGQSQPEEITDPTEVEISLVSVMNNVFLDTLSEKWKRIFPFTPNAHHSTFGHYKFHPQQAENETIIELNASFKLFNQHDLSCKVIYSLETIEKILFFDELLNSNIVENTHLSSHTLKNTKINVKSIIGETTLALNELQHIEVGDVILLENQKLTDPIKVIVGDSILFNAVPITINDKEIGVQILNTPQFDQYKKEASKPSVGPFIASNNTQHLTPSDAPTTTGNNAPQNEGSSDTEENDPLKLTMNPTTKENFDSINDSSQTIYANNDAITNAPLITEDPSNEGIASDDFSWDDLDDG